MFFLVATYLSLSLSLSELVVCWTALTVSDSSLLNAGGRRPAEEKGDLDGLSSLSFLLRHGYHEGRRPKHPHPGALCSLLCHWSHHWQAGPVETQTDRAQWQTGGRRTRQDTCQWRQRGCLLGLMLVSLSFLFFFFTFKATWLFVWMENSLMCKKRMKQGDPKLNHECEGFCHRSCLCPFFGEIITTSDLFFPSIPPSFLNDLPQLAQVTVVCGSGFTLTECLKSFVDSSSSSLSIRKI